MVKKLSPEDYLEKLKEEIMSSGIPLEIFSSVILEKLGWEIKQSSFYKSKESGKDREIDIISEKDSISLSNVKNVLVVECKKSEKKPWIFFTQGKIIDSPRGGIVSTADIAGLLDKLKKNFDKIHYYKKPYHLYSLFPYTNKFGEIHKDESQIQSALWEIIPATSFLMNQYKDSYYKTGKKFDFMFFPIIVVDGDLISAKIEGDKINLDFCNSLQFVTSYELDAPIEIFYPLRKEILKTRNFVISVVKKEYLEEFLKNSFG